MDTFTPYLANVKTRGYGGFVGVVVGEDQDGYWICEDDNVAFWPYKKVKALECVEAILSYTFKFLGTNFTVGATP
jgi:hypothetical protein